MGLAVAAPAQPVLRLATSSSALSVGLWWAVPGGSLVGARLLPRRPALTVSDYKASHGDCWGRQWPGTGVLAGSNNLTEICDVIGEGPWWAAGETIMGSYFSIPVMRPKRPVRPRRWGVQKPAWAAVATLIVVAGCASEEPTGAPVSVSASPTPAETSPPPSSPPSPTPSPPPPPPPPPKPKPEPEPRAASQCHPNYSGACVPIASDVDCEGGNGNGPAYVQGPVNVIGEDVYGLDGKDNDGLGCES